LSIDKTSVSQKHDFDAFWHQPRNATKQVAIMMESNTTAIMLNYPPTHRYGTTAMDNAHPDNAILIPQGCGV
jgi:hypothetical protein